MPKRKRRKRKKFNLKGYIFGALRKIWRWYPERKKVLDEAEIWDSEGEPWYTCSKCTTVWPRKQVHVDHIKPVIDPKKGFVDWNTYIDRLFVKMVDLQVLCTNCHHEKSLKENKKRRKRNGK